MKTSSRRKFLQSVSLAGIFLPFTNRANYHPDHDHRYIKNKHFVSAGSDDYLSELKAELNKEWPNNRTINLVFHGHSVPTGYFKTPYVNTLGAYPHLLLAKVKERYPNAVINAITTSIGGENSVQGAKRIDEVLNHRPDVVFIDYALNDRAMGLPAARTAWIQMIQRVLDKDIKLVLLTPSPDLNEDIMNTDSVLNKHSGQIQELAKEFRVGLADSYDAFRDLAHNGVDLSVYMAQFNHPNEKGHQLIADRLFSYFG